jgi:hypothetical protein
MNAFLAASVWTRCRKGSGQGSNNKQEYQMKMTQEQIAARTAKRKANRDQEYAARLAAYERKYPNKTIQRGSHIKSLPTQGPSEADIEGLSQQEHSGGCP